VIHSSGHLPHVLIAGFRNFRTSQCLNGPANMQGAVQQQQQHRLAVPACCRFDAASTPPLTQVLAAAAASAAVPAAAAAAAAGAAEAGPPVSCSPGRSHLEPAAALGRAVWSWGWCRRSCASWEGAARTSCGSRSWRTSSNCLSGDRVYCSTSVVCQS